MGQQQKVNRSRRESMHTAGGAREMGTGEEMSPFFSESILRTEHDGVRPYAHPVTGLLLAISRQTKTTDRPKANTYRQWVRLQGPQGKNVWMHAVIDGGAMLNTLCVSVWEKQRDRLTH